MKLPKQFKPKRAGGAKKFDGRKNIKAMYNSQDWVSYSKAYLGINRRCYVCGDKSQVVDHLKAHKGDEKLFKTLDNHIPLCTICHNKITNYFDRFSPPKYKEKLEYMAFERGKRGLTFKILVLPKYGK